LKHSHSKSKQRDCLDALVSLDGAIDRLRIASVGASFLRGYRDRFHRLERCNAMGRQLAESTFEAERHLRIILKVGLDSLNDLMDSGNLMASFRGLLSSETPNNLAEGYERTFGEALKGAPKLLAGHFEGLDTSYFEDAMTIGSDLHLAVQGDKDTLQIHFKTADGRQDRVAIGVTPRPGSLGRISSRQFFGKGGGTCAALRDSSLIQDDCHHRKQGLSLATSAHSVDVYGGILHSFATARDSMYRHARVVDEFGAAYIRGNDLVITPWLVAVVVGSFLLASGATISIGCDVGIWDPNSNTCNWGSKLTAYGSIVILVTCAVSGGLQCIKGLGVGLKDFIKIPGTAK
jgi:hypothetical protein